MKIHILDAGHGDCLLIESNNVKILVDSGPKKYKTRERVINTLHSLLNGCDIDIAFVTHNDDDHIGAFKYIIENGIGIKAFIFNSIKTIPEIVQHTIRNYKISSRQDNELNDIIKKSASEHRTLCYGDETIIINDIKITPILPKQSTLERYYEIYEKSLKQAKISTSSKEQKSIKAALDIVKNEEDQLEKDPSITNKTSLSFIIEDNTHKFLFLGDAHEEDVYNYLSQESITNNFTAVKLSHHGSERNTSSRLLNTIGKTEYIICADKSKHDHPNSLTLARIVHFNNNATIHFSCENKLISSTLCELNECGYDIKFTNSTDGVNTLIYG